MTSSPKVKILLVDDTEENIDLLIGIFGDDYDLSVAMDGPSALKRVSQIPPDLILLDIMMPGMDGYEVCRQLKTVETTRNIPIIFLTAMTEEHDETEGLAIGKQGTETGDRLFMLDRSQRFMR